MLEITFEDIKQACYGNISPFSPSEIVELMTLENNEQAFHNKMIELLSKPIAND